MDNKNSYDLQSFLDWQREVPGRSVNITLGEYGHTEYTYIWVYDYNTHVGQIVKSVDEIDLEGQKEEQELQQLRRLQEKYKDRGVK